MQDHTRVDNVGGSIVVAVDLDVVCTRAALCERLQLTGFDRAVRVRSSIA